MTNKEYLRQAYRLDQKINSDIEEVARLREMSTSITSPVLGDKVQTSRNGDAPFVRSIEKILMLEAKIDREIDLLVDLKSQMRDVIAAVPESGLVMMLLCLPFVPTMGLVAITRRMISPTNTVSAVRGLTKKVTIPSTVPTAKATA